MKSYMKIKDLYSQNGHSVLSVDYVIDDEIDLTEVKCIEYKGTTYRPLRHAHWIEVTTDDDLWRCSVCKELSCCYSRYCSTCGARMDKVTK